MTGQVRENVHRPPTRNRWSETASLGSLVVVSTAFFHLAVSIAAPAAVACALRCCNWTSLASRGWGCSAALLFEAWLLTSFYTAWLSALFMMLQAGVFILGSGYLRRARELVRLHLFWPVIGPVSFELACHAAKLA